MSTSVPIETLVELLGYSLGLHPSWATPPTPGSLKRIGEELEIGIPHAFAMVATACPVYGALFAGIGEDYDYPLHILALRKSFLKKGLPGRYVMFNHGNDDDCFCWDVEGALQHGERPIVHYNLSLGHEDSPGHSRCVTPLADSFVGFLEWYCRRQPPGHGLSKSARRRAKMLYEQAWGPW